MEMVFIFSASEDNYQDDTFLIYPLFQLVVPAQRSTLLQTIVCGYILKKVGLLMSNANPSKTVIIYRDAAGTEPFTDWLNGLRDPRTRRRILKRLLRVESGHYGDRRMVGGGVRDYRFFFGAGYRVYFGEDGDKIVVLLCGGDKDGQRRDIQQAQTYWKEYLSHA